MRGRLRGSGNTGGNPGADDDDDDPPRGNDNPPRGGGGSGGSMNTADVEALVQRALKRDRELARRDAEKASRQAYFEEIAERKREKRAAGKKKKHHNADDSADGDEADPDTGTLSRRAAGQWQSVHTRITQRSCLRGGQGGPGTQYQSPISKGELGEAREHIPTMPDGKQLCIKQATHDGCDRDPCYFSHAELPAMMSSPAAIKCLPCVV